LKKGNLEFGAGGFEQGKQTNKQTNKQEQRTSYGGESLLGGY